ncbi:hypothetical protein VOLCADRAFT_97617 [Volvox carteri f. nagariensis]|uniref:Uncharacterized protein n=1 Tax=Volvox carteri f. nagariensis TaxID=3068 RepID=D8UD69_VOLCA|nr:uncharacterized protein VOLCADRAFT_97617 [Volvox carteri f. nagariensis]EFJ42380.1 hypothetical protein VOLCADRAFT_97617 [Volvox carteri f. nagariensis]|eukprot:XP_002956613.1 hypothetical protein VOLCADRAFT_97617 [Volvox carteri f. nagariensis]
MRAGLHSCRSTAAHVQTRAVAVPGAAALAVRPHPVSGQAQALVVCHIGVCPLHLNDACDYVRLEPPLALRNQHASKFNLRNVHDAAYDSHSGLVLFAHGTSIYGMDSTNRVAQLAGDDEGGLLFDGIAAEARFIGAQRIAADGHGVTYIRDRDSGSRNGFCLRALYEATMPNSLIGCGVRAVVSVNTGGDMGPHVLTYDSWRRTLLFATRGRAIHQLLSYGITEELVGTDEPAAPYGVGAAAAAASSSFDSSQDATVYGDLNRNGLTAVAAATAVTATQLLPPSPDCKAPLTNVQALAADGSSGNVYFLDGTTGSKTMLRVLRPNGSLETLEEQLRIGPSGNSRWPRLAVLPYGYLAVYGTSSHEMMLLKL